MFRAGSPLFRAFRAPAPAYPTPMSARDLVLHSVEKLPADAGWNDVLDEVIGLAASHQEVAGNETGIAAVLSERAAQLEVAGIVGCIPHAQVMRQAASWPGR